MVVVVVAAVRVAEAPHGAAVAVHQAGEEEGLQEGAGLREVEPLAGDEEGSEAADEAEQEVERSRAVEEAVADEAAFKGRLGCERDLCYNS